MSDRLLVSRRDVSQRFRDAVTADHVVATVVQVLQEGTPLNEVEILGGSVTVDGRAAVRRRMSLSVGDPALIPNDSTDLLTPYGNELQVFRGFRYPDGDSELASLGVFPIQTTDTSSEPGDTTVSVDALDRSQRFADATFERDGQIAPGTKAVDAMLELALEVWPSVPRQLPDLAITLPRMEYSADGDRWGFIQGIAAGIGYETYFNSDGIWRMAAITEKAPGQPDVVISEGPEARLASGEYDTDGNLLAIRRNWSREETYNKWTVIPNSDNAEIGSGVAVDDDPRSPTNYYGRFGKKPAPAYRNQFVTTLLQAEDAAKGLRARDRGLLDSIDFTAFTDPAMDVGMVALVRRGELDLNDEHVIDTLTLPLDIDGEMSATTRAVRFV